MTRIILLSIAVVLGFSSFGQQGERFTNLGIKAKKFRSPIVILGDLPLGDTAVTIERLFTFEESEPLSPPEITPLPVDTSFSGPINISSIEAVPPAPQWADADVPSIEDEGERQLQIDFDDSYAREEINGFSADSTSVKTSRPPQIVTTYPDWAKDENFGISDSLSKAIKNMNVQLGTFQPTAIPSATLDSLSTAASAKTRQIDSLQAALADLQARPVQKDSLVIQGTDTVIIERIIEKSSPEAVDNAATQKLEAELARLNQEVKDTEAYRKRLIEQEKNRFKLLAERDKQIANEAKRAENTQRKFDRGVLRNDAAETAAMLKMASEQTALREEVATLKVQLAALAAAVQSDTAQTLVIAAPPVLTTIQPASLKAPATDTVLVSELSALRKEMSALRQSMVAKPAAPVPAPAPVVIAPTMPSTPAPSRIEAEILSLLSESGSAQVFFATGKSAVTAEGREALVELAKGASTYPNRVLVRLTGFTDKTGSLAANQALSQRRVDAVRNALISMGVSPTQIRSNANGPDLNTKDLASARRVEVALKVR